jgi:PEP-CTERM motif
MGIVAVVALAMFAANVAKADGLDPHAKVTVPTDPGYQPCSMLTAPDDECFTSPTTQVYINGPTSMQVADDPDLVLDTNFFYEPDCAIPGSLTPCTSADTIMTLSFYFTNSISGGIYTCDVDTNIPNTAFNACAITGFGSIGGVIETEGVLSCVPTPNSPCTGMLPTEEGSAVVWAPEPGTLAMLGFGLSLVGLASWKRRKALNLGRQNRADFASC